MVNKCVAGCRSNYHAEITIPGFSIPTKHENFKIKTVGFVKNWQPSLTVVISISHFEEQKVKRAQLINQLKPQPSIYPNSIQSSDLPKIPLTSRSPRKKSFQEDQHADFAANDTISTLNDITKQGCTTGYIFKRHDDHTVLPRKIAKMSG